MYPSLNPFLVRKEKATEVFRLIRLIQHSNKYTDDGSYIKEDGTKVTRINVTGKRGTGGWI